MHTGETCNMRLDGRTVVPQQATVRHDGHNIARRSGVYMMACIAMRTHTYLGLDIAVCAG